jgi:hypothetical protein
MCMANYNSVKQKDLKRKIFIEDLLAAGITVGQNGESIYEMSNAELKSELALHSYRKIDITSDSQRWF